MSIPAEKVVERSVDNVQKIYAVIIALAIAQAIQNLLKSPGSTTVHLSLRQVATTEEAWLRTFLELAFTYGWRCGELLGLRVRQVNFVNRTIRLDPGSTKNREGREVAMTPKVFELLQLACENKNTETHVLTRDGGRPVKDFRWAWRKLCVSAGLGKFICCACKETAKLALEAVYQCPKCKTVRGHDFRYEGLIPHDMRRSAAKALRRAGVPESVIMATGGWKTAAMFRRYAIVSSADSRDAMELLERSRAQRTAALAPETSSLAVPETIAEKGIKPN